MSSVNTRLTTEQFIDRVTVLYGTKYDYTLVKYIDAHTPVDIICGKHGVFSHKPYIFWGGRGCKQCDRDARKLIPKLTTIEFIDKANNIHNNVYDYSLVQYKSSKEHVTIICKLHGVFNQIPNTHLDNHGCPQCGTTLAANKRAMLQEDYIDKAVAIHGNKYDYSLINYINATTKIEILCKIHGEFWQKPSDHINGRNGCPSCRSSKGEDAIKIWLNDNNITYITEHQFKDCIHERMLKFDFYLPDYNICVEFDGVQHYRPFSFSSDRSEETMKNNLALVKTRDEIKNIYCIDNNIILIRIRYNQIKEIPRILSNML
jgi:protein-arginine kinase activator protein McsA